MRTKLFIFAMLASVAAIAQSHINIEMLSATYTASPAVKFRVSWSSIPTVTGQTHNAKIWAWIDFLKLNADNTTVGNTWIRAEISTTPAISSSPASTATLDASTNKGFWLNGVTGSYSATVTATLSNIPANTRFNWCAYASDCPPNVMATNGTYTFKGTPPFTLTASGGATQTVTGTTLAASALTITPTTIRDKTECPGVFCIYNGSDLHIDATHFCQQRASGDKNWEAYIKDSRDNKLYRIVYMPDDKWWLAQNLDYRSGNYKCGINQTDYCDKYGIMLHLTDVIPSDICPDGWILPTWPHLLALVSNDSQIHLLKSETTWQGNTNDIAAPGTDYYGFTLLATGFVDHVNQTCYYSEGTAAYLIFRPPTGGYSGCYSWITGRNNGQCLNGGPWTGMWHSVDDDWGYIRCLRQL